MLAIFFHFYFNKWIFEDKILRKQKTRQQQCENKSLDGNAQMIFHCFGGRFFRAVPLTRSSRIDFFSVYSLPKLWRARTQSLILFRIFYDGPRINFIISCVIHNNNVRWKPWRASVSACSANRMHILLMCFENNQRSYYLAKQSRFANPE